jgi:hypothetical protein
MTEQVAWLAERIRPSSAANVAAIRARAWMLGPVLLFGLLGALIATQLRAREWRSQAEVVIRVQPVGPEYWQEQAHLARSPELARRVVLKAGVPGVTAERFLRHSSATPPDDADDSDGLACIDPCPELATNQILTLSVSDQRSARAVRLTNTYASEFVRLRREVAGRQIDRTLASIHLAMTALRGRGQTNTPRYRTLAERERQIRMVLRQFASNVATRPSEGAASFRPHALRNGLVGGLLGALVGVALVIAASARSRRDAERRRESSD